MRLSDFLTNVVGSRRIPKTSGKVTKPPCVLVKMDIEGSETDVISDLLATGSFHHINILGAEFHHHQGHQHLQTGKYNASKLMEKLVLDLSEISQLMRKTGKEFYFTARNLDDETYGNSTPPFPSCEKFKMS